MVDARSFESHRGQHDVRGHDANDHDDNARSRGGDRHVSDLSAREHRGSVRHESGRHGNVHDAHARRLSNRQC